MAEREMIGHTRVIPAAAWLAQRAVSGTFGVATFAVMTGLGAHVRIPLPWTPVPVTLQTFFVHLAGATLGPSLGPMSQAVYLLAGAVGLPVFAGGGSGLPHLLQGITTGYLVGFVLATALVGRLVRRRSDPSFLWTLASMAAGSLVVYACGVSWLAWSLRLSLPTALAQGMFPFLVGDLLKVCAAAGLFRSYRRRSRIMFP
jgi:biotin transport system substrate-specific component